MTLLNKLRNVSVKVKILGITLGLVLLMGVTSIFIVRELLVIKLTEDLERRALSIASDLSSRGTDFTILQDIYSLDKLIKEMERNNPDIEYIFFLDHQDHVIIHNLGKEYEVSLQLIQLNRDTDWFEQSYQLHTFISENGVIHDVLSPMLEGDVGFVRVGLNENQIAETINELTFILIISTTLIGIVGVIIAYLLTRIMYRDLTKLIQVSNEVGKGNLNCSVAIESNDEIGLLGREFNTMIQHLKEKNDENLRYLDQLKMRNNELALLNQLSVTALDASSFKRHLNQTVTQLKEELQLLSCFIEIQLSGEKLEFIQGETACLTCLQATSVNCQRSKSKHKTFPLKTMQRGVGKIVICFKEEPNGIQLRFIDSFARQLSIIIENVELWQELKYKEELRLKLLDKVITAQEEERRRIARELHDETSQSLTSITLGLSMLEEVETAEEKRSKLLELKEIAEKTMAEVHYISWSLRPSALDDYGLLPAIKMYANDFSKKYGVEVDIQVIGFEQVRLPSTVEVTIYRVIQEALTNVARYAEAESVSIIIKQARNQVSLIIEDDGIGFDVAKILDKKIAKEHLGLKGMQERIESIGGHFFIESNPGFGTSIYVNNIEIGGELAAHENHVSGRS